MKNKLCLAYDILVDNMCQRWLSANPAMDEEAASTTAGSSARKRRYNLFRLCSYSCFSWFIRVLHIFHFVRFNERVQSNNNNNNNNDDVGDDYYVKRCYHRESVNPQSNLVFGDSSILFCVSRNTSRLSSVVQSDNCITNNNSNHNRIFIIDNTCAMNSNNTGNTTVNMNGVPPSGASKTSYQKPTPPPTLPKTYTSGAASAYRLASLERIAHRQRNFDQNGVSESPLQTKRELFFMNELSNATTSTSSTSSVLSSVGTPTTAVSVTTSISITPSPVTSTLTTALPKPTLDSATLANNLSSTAPNTSSSFITVNSMPSSTTVRTNINYKDVYSKKVNEKVESLQDTPDNRDRYIVKTVDKEKSISQEKQFKELDGYVGFAEFPNQVHRKAIKKGSEFTLMVVGESGLGKSTLINSLFLSEIYCDSHVGPSHRIKKTVQVETSQCLLKENSVNLTLTIVDTPGFGDAVDNSNCWQPVIDYIESRYEEYLNAESRVNRKPISDTRVHCCLYFIAPSGHGLKPLDVEFMQRLHDKVNIIPIISKADTMTPEECAYFKKQVMNGIAQHKIKIYEFPDKTTDNDIKLHKNLKERVPFAVVGSNIVLEVDGKKIRGRKYPWGIAEVENLQHCDFIALRDMMIRTHLQDLKDVTNNVHYENYRCRRLAGLGAECMKSKGLNKNPLAQMEEEKREHDIKMKKMEAEMDQVFEAKVKEKKQKLKESEAELQRRHEQMKQSLELQIKELEDKKQKLELEKAQWEQLNGISLDELRRRSLERDSLDGKEKKNKKKGLF